MNQPIAALAPTTQIAATRPARDAPAASIRARQERRSASAVPPDSTALQAPPPSSPARRVATRICSTSFNRPTARSAMRSVATGSTSPPHAHPPYTDTTGRSECRPCPGGTYQDQSGETTVRTALAGISPARRGGRAAVLGGLLPNQPNLAHADNCTAGSIGSACSTGSTTHTLCSPGTYNRTRARLSAPNARPAARRLRARRRKVCREGYTARAAAALPCPGGTQERLTYRDEC